MKIVCIKDDGNIIGIAKNTKSAIEYLIEKEIIHADTDICVTPNYSSSGPEWLRVGMLYGLDWKNTLANMSISEFNDLFEDWIFLKEFDIIGTPNINAEKTLKPCPFCGSPVYLEKKPLWSTHGGVSRGYVGDYEYIVKCPNTTKCGCSLNLHDNDTVYRSDEEAINNVINAWNQRN